MAATPFADRREEARAAEKVTVVVYGPNLRHRRGDSGEAFHVHTPGCADTRRPLYRLAEQSWRVSVGSVRELVTEVYPPGDFEYDADTDELDCYASDVRIFPCVKGLS